MTDCKGVAAAAHGCFIAPQVPPLKPVAHPLHIHVCCFFTCVFRLAWAIAKLRLLHLFYCSAIAAPKACSTYILPTPLAIIEALVLRNGFDLNLVVTVSNVGAANHDLRFYIWVSHLFSCTVYFGEGTSSNRSFVVSQSMGMYMRDIRLLSVALQSIRGCAAMHIIVLSAMTCVWWCLLFVSRVFVWQNIALIIF